MRRRYLAIPLFLALTLVSCDGSPVNLLATAAKASAESGNVRFEVVIGPGPEGENPVTISGVIDPAAGTFEMADGETGPTVMLTRDRMLIREPGGATWYQIDLTDTLAAAWNPSTLLDPGQVAQAALGKLRRVGEDDIRGQKATHYQFDLDREAYARDGLFGLIADALGDVSSVVIQADVWLDAKGRVVRFRLETPTSGGAEAVSVTVEFWDYGAAPAIVLPPEDQIEDFEDFDLGDLPDPFASADCYGSNLDHCLQPGAELLAMAGDPQACRGSVARVCLVPFGAVRPEVVEAIVRFHRETAGIDVVVMPALPVDPAWIKRDSSQVVTERVYDAMVQHFEITRSTPSAYIAITPIDTVPETDEYGWWFGRRFGGGPLGNSQGVFSYFRMANVEPYDGTPLDDALLFERASKYAGRYVALLYLHHPLGEDYAYLNYKEMYGFSDLDSMGTKWPPGPAPCLGPEQVVCVFLDGEFANPALEPDVRIAAERLAAELGIRVDVRLPFGVRYVPTLPSWSDEFLDDLRLTVPGLISAANVTLVGFTDDGFVQGPGLAPHADRAVSAERLAVVSAFDPGGVPGTETHREMVYRLLLRAVAQARYNVALNGDPGSLMYTGHETPSQLQGTALPTLPR